jgi:hypothetical protein
LKQRTASMGSRRSSEGFPSFSRGSHDKTTRQVEVELLKPGRGSISIRHEVPYT